MLGPIDMRSVCVAVYLLIDFFGDRTPTCGCCLLLCWYYTQMGWGCSSVGRASDRHVSDAGLIPQCGKGFFSQSQLSVETLMVSIHPCVQSHTFTSVYMLKIL